MCIKCSCESDIELSDDIIIFTTPHVDNIF